MENSFKSIIEQSNSIMIFLPTNPHVDQVASGLSLYLSLKDVKPVQIVAVSPITVSLNRLIGVDKISNEIGNRNLVIGFLNYDANNIEKVSYDIIENQFKLTVLPKAHVGPPEENQVKVTYEGVSADTVILIGGATDSHFPQLATQSLESAKMYHIGTRPLTVDPSRVVYTFAQPMASVAELTFFLLKEAQLLIDADIATNLLMGIEDATQNYKSKNVTADTFDIIASLIRLGGRRLSMESSDTAKYPKGSIPQKVEGTLTPEPKVIKQAVSPTDFADFSETGKEASQEERNESIPVPTDDDNKEGEENEEYSNPPSDWLQPKVYRGTSLN